MRHLLTCLRGITAVAVVTVLLLLAWQCIDIYMDGNGPGNRDDQGVYLASVFRWEDVAERLCSLTIPLMICGGICVVTGILHLIFPADAKKPHVDKSRAPLMQKECCDMLPTGGRLIRLRTAIFVIAIVFIVLGVMNGGLRDVLVKAINICTECIGLG